MNACTHVRMYICMYVHMRPTRRGSVLGMLGPAPRKTGPSTHVTTCRSMAPLLYVQLCMVRSMPHISGHAPSAGVCLTNPPNKQGTSKRPLAMVDYCPLQRALFQVLMRTLQSLMLSTYWCSGLCWFAPCQDRGCRSGQSPARSEITGAGRRPPWAICEMNNVF